MGLLCESSVVKYFLFSVNVVIWLVGVFLLAFGIWILVIGSSFDTTWKSMENMGIFLCVMGSLTFIVAGLGCYGSIIESINCLMIYARLVLFLIITQFYILIHMGVFYNNEVYNSTYDINSKIMVEHYAQASHKGLTVNWNRFQIKKKCCGAENGPEDWRKSNWYNGMNPRNQHVPDSCCTNLTDPSDYNNPKPRDPKLCYEAAINETMIGRERYVHVKGCEQYVNPYKTAIVVIICILVTLLLVQLIMVSMACFLSSSIEDSFPTAPYTVLRAVYV